MKKKTIRVLTGLCALALLAGCGKAKDNSGRDYVPSDYVKLGEYKGVEVSVEKLETSEAAVKEYIEKMIANYPAGYDTLDKAQVEKGDHVNIDYEGLQDGVAFQGGTAKDQVLEIGGGRFIPGFEDGLIGANVGDSLALNLTFPETYSNNPDLAGKDVVFNVTVNAIVSPIPAAYDTMTDEYVASNFTYYGFTTVQGFKDGVKEYLDSDNQYKMDTNTRNAIMDKLMENCKVDQLPEGLLDKRVNDYKEKFEAMCQQQYGMGMADYLKLANMTEEDFNTETVKNMKESIQTELILLAIAEKEDIKLDEEGYQKFLTSMKSNYNYASDEELFKDYEEDYVKDSYVCNLTMTMLVENAKVNYTEPSAAAAE